MSKEATIQGRHTRTEVIPGDLVVCGCGAVGEVKVKGRWPFKRYEIEWYESEAGAMLVRGRLPPEDAAVVMERAP